MGYRFGPVEVDTVNEELLVDGVSRAIEPQVLSVLTYLIEHRHRVVPKNDLLDEVWGSRFVSAAAVTSRIKSARQAIGDSGRDQRLIRTIHGRGYRFVAPIDDDPAPPNAQAAPQPDTHVLVRAEHGGRSIEEGWPLMGRDNERDTALRLTRTPDEHGLLITGSAGLGKTRLARAILDGAAELGSPTARINGQLGASSVPLAALAHLLPPDIAEIPGLQSELGRTLLLQRARSAIHSIAGDDRLVLMVDDIERVDNLSQVLLGSLIADGTVFAVMTQRITGDEELAMKHLIRSGELAHLRLDKVPDDQMLALLGRVLDGPVQPMTGSSLVAAASGFPGVLRQLVEGALADDTLRVRSGVWRLEGRLSPPGDMAAAIRQRLESLDDDQRDALELLALAGDLDLDVAYGLIDDEVLDRLELEGLIAVGAVGASTRIRLSHPLYGEMLTHGVTALRSRRHLAKLTEALAETAPSNAADRLQLVRLQFANQEPIDDDSLIESASLALVEGDTSLALKLLRQVSAAGQTPRHQQILGEVLYLSGRFDEAGEVWKAIDLDSLDDDIAAGVTRRIATWSFYGEWRFEEALTQLDEAMQRFDGENRLALESYWTMLAGIDGRRADEVIERTDRYIDEATGYAAVDFLSGSSMAHFVLGRYRRALELLEECNRRARGLAQTIHWNDLGYANFVEILCYVELGELDRAWATYERIAKPGEPPGFGFPAMSAGRAALASGHWQQVIDWLDPKIQITEALGITTNGRPLQGNTGLAAFMAGDAERAGSDLAKLRADLPNTTNTTVLDIRWCILHLEGWLGQNESTGDEFLAAARTARDADMAYMEAMLLSGAAYHGKPAEVVERLGMLTQQIDGELITLRHRAAQLLADRIDVGPHITELEQRGLVFEAEVLRRSVARSQ